MVKIKICGITNLPDATTAVDCGADALGFIFYPQSRRYVTPEKVKEITAKLPPLVFKIGVFVDESAEKIQEIAKDCRLDAVQLHGDESPDFCRLFPCRVIKGFRPQNEEQVSHISNYQVDLFLLDSYHPDLPGGTGATFDWELAVAAKMFNTPVILSGGLTPANVGEAIRLVKPYGVDVASGVEAFQGKKDPNKIRDFIQQVQWASE